MTYAAFSLAKSAFWRQRARIEEHVAPLDSGCRPAAAGASAEGGAQPRAWTMNWHPPPTQAGAGVNGSWSATQTAAISTVPMSRLEPENFIDYDTMADKLKARAACAPSCRHAGLGSRQPAAAAACVAARAAGPGRPGCASRARGRATRASRCAGCPQAHQQAVDPRREGASASIELIPPRSRERFLRAPARNRLSTATWTTRTTQA